MPTDAVREQPERFLELVREGEQAARSLQETLDAAGLVAPEQARRASLALARVSDNCAACHREFRDVPLGEKRSTAQ